MDEGQKGIRESVQVIGVVNHILCEGEAVVSSFLQVARAWDMDPAFFLLIPAPADKDPLSTAISAPARLLRKMQTVCAVLMRVFLKLVREESAGSSLNADSQALTCFSPWGRPWNVDYLLAQVMLMGEQGSWELWPTASPSTSFLSCPQW